MALVYADYKLTWVDIRANGSAPDAAIFSYSELEEVTEPGAIHFPAADPLLHDDRPMSYYIIGDDTFPLMAWLIKPFSRRNLPYAEPCLIKSYPGVGE